MAHAMMKTAMRRNVPALLKPVEFRIDEGSVLVSFIKKPFIAISVP
jgi:hypothetical protein